MSADVLAQTVVFAMALPATGIVVLYALVPWRNSRLGRRFMVQSIGLAALVDIAALYQLFGDNYPGRDYVRITVYALIFLGEWGIFLEQIRARRARNR